MGGKIGGGVHKETSHPGESEAGTVSSCPGQPRDPESPPLRSQGDIVHWRRGMCAWSSLNIVSQLGGCCDRLTDILQTTLPSVAKTCRYFSLSTTYFLLLNEKYNF